MPRLKDINSNIAAFLDMLAFSEGTIHFGNDDGYNVIVGGSLFDNYDKHPNKLIQINKTLKSTAAGRYQLLSRYYTAYKESCNVPDFGPESQDKIAIQMIKEQGAMKLIIDGNIAQAINRCCNIWASLPGAGYGQHEHEMGVLLKKFIDFGGKLS